MSATQEKNSILILLTENGLLAVESQQFEVGVDKGKLLAEIDDHGLARFIEDLFRSKEIDDAAMFFKTFIMKAFETGVEWGRKFPEIKLNS